MSLRIYVGRIVNRAEWFPMIIDSLPLYGFTLRRSAWRVSHFRESTVLEEIPVDVVVGATNGTKDAVLTLKKDSFPRLIFLRNSGLELGR